MFQPIKIRDFDSIFDHVTTILFTTYIEKIRTNSILPFYLPFDWLACISMRIEVVPFQREEKSRF